MTTESHNTPPISLETVPREVQNRILHLCLSSGMAPEQLQILHHILRNYDNPQLEETTRALGKHSGTVEGVTDEVRKQL
ncbi:MAG: hypothetical protein AAB551_03135 [Patescibacteria group bacterium]